MNPLSLCLALVLYIERVAGQVATAGRKLKELSFYERFMLDPESGHDCMIRGQAAIAR